MAWSVSYISDVTKITFNVCVDIGGGSFYIQQPNGAILPVTIYGIVVQPNQCITLTIHPNEFTQEGMHVLYVNDLLGHNQVMVDFIVTLTPAFAVNPVKYPPELTPTYKCVNNTCTYTTCDPVTDTSCYTENTCGNTCIVSDVTYKCVNNVCTPTACNPATEVCYAENTCAGACTAATTYSCIDNACVESICTIGTTNCYINDTCDNICPTPPSPCTSPNLSILGNCIHRNYFIAGGAVIFGLLVLLSSGSEGEL